MATYSETDLAAAIERLAGVPLAALTPDRLDGIDQFHAGGAAAVDRLLPHLALGPGSTGLDVGSGLGGPARQIARATGCRVVGVDLAPAHVAAATALSAAAGLAERTSFVDGDVAALPRARFDAAWTVHVQMNVADKAGFYAAIAQRLRPGGRLAVFEVCRGAGGAPELPLPWSLDGSDSHLVGPDELRDTIVRAGGFTPVAWVDETAWVRDWFDGVGRRMAESGPAPAALPALLADGPLRMLNFAIAAATSAVTVHRGFFTLP